MHDKLTKQDIEKMQAEIDRRKLELRPQILAELKEARAQGDLSENFEYYAAKKARGENDGRIRYLENMIRTAVIVEDHSDADQVGLDKRVVLAFDGNDDDTEEYKIVTSVRGNSLEGRITPESPLGRALMGHRPGDKVHVKVSDTIEYDVVIKEVAQDDEEDEIRKY
ncbi:MAG: transcription elongation factor GreA [Eubacterium sp.]|nr:transcription elongation factor GreA [Eubacterium sp.]